MVRNSFLAHGFRGRIIVAQILVSLLGAGGLAHAQQAKKIDVLHIGTSGSLALNASGTKEETAPRGGASTTAPPKAPEAGGKNVAQQKDQEAQKKAAEEKAANEEKK